MKYIARQQLSDVGRGSSFRNLRMNPGGVFQILVQLRTISHGKVVFMLDVLLDS